ncbi:MAG: CBS domain-containing protein [Nitrospirae bacterium]|nr:CBS domain-containing protein [Nitrospirota bacterium]
MITVQGQAHAGHREIETGHELLVQDIMTTKVISVHKYENVDQAVKVLSDNNISGLPVVDKKNQVVGMISEADILSMIGMRRGHTLRDILRHIFGEPLPERRMGDVIGDVMTSPVVTVGPDVDIREAAKIMDEKKVRRLPVVDDGKKLIGLISRADIVRAMSKKMK